MNINISNSSAEPIYAQITAQIKAQIISGVLAEGDALPSMRTLAAELRISVITTKRAYEELEREGFIESCTGRGSFVKGQSGEMLREQTLKEAEELLTQAADKARRCGVTLGELTDILKMVYGVEE